jgi:hypothetical protein
MKKIIFLISLVGITSLFNACSGGYVSVQPTYQGVYVPARPSGNYIWIEGNWYWNSRTRTYNYRDGYWTTPRQKQYYKPGYWNNTRRGYRWVPGGWR